MTLYAERTSCESKDLASILFGDSRRIMPNGKKLIGGQKCQGLLMWIDGWDLFHLNFRLDFLLFLHRKFLGDSEPNTKFFKIY